MLNTIFKTALNTAVFLFYKLSLSKQKFLTTMAVNTKLIYLSGVPTEITYFGGEQQGILTGKGEMSQKAHRVAMSIVKTLGSIDVAGMKPVEREEFFKTVLACHIKQILTEGRMFTYDDEEFVFTFEWLTDDKVKKSVEQVVPLENGFPITPVRRVTPGMFTGVTKSSQLAPILAQAAILDCKEYAEVVENSTIEFTLPFSGTELRINMRNGLSSAIIAQIMQADELDSNAAIASANPKWKDVESGAWINYGLRDIRKAHARDLEYIRTILKGLEGSVDTELEFEHPGTKGRVEHTDLINQPSFFFQSGGI